MNHPIPLVLYGHFVYMMENPYLDIGLCPSVRHDNTTQVADELNRLIYNLLAPFFVLHKILELILEFYKH